LKTSTFYTEETLTEGTIRLDRDQINYPNNVPVTL